MKERAFLVAAVVVLFSGLGVWATLADRDRADEAMLLTRPPAPRIGGVVAAGDERAAAVRRTLAGAMLGDQPVLRLFARGAVPVHGIVLRGSDGIGVWDRLRENAAASGHWPVVVGDGWDLRVHADAASSTVDSPEAIVARSLSIDVDAELARRLAAIEVSDGEWPADAEPDSRERFRTVRDRDLDLPRAEVAIALLAAQASSEAPAWLAFGNWQGCPEPTVHVAVLSRWRERFGAEVVAIGSDTIELRVARPPTERDAARALAREHVAYAPALSDEGRRSIAEIAATHSSARVWTFRWPRGASSRRASRSR